MIISIFQDGCCSTYKYEIDDKNTGEKLTVARHGTADDGDEVWVQLPCMYYEVRLNIQIQKIIKMVSIIVNFNVLSKEASNHYPHYDRKKMLLMNNAKLRI